MLDRLQVVRPLAVARGVSGAVLRLLGGPGGFWAALSGSGPSYTATEVVGSRHAPGGWSVRPRGRIVAAWESNGVVGLAGKVAFVRPDGSGRGWAFAYRRREYDCAARPVALCVTLVLTTGEMPADAYTVVVEDAAGAEVGRCVPAVDATNHRATCCVPVPGVGTYAVRVEIDVTPSGGGTPCVVEREVAVADPCTDTHVTIPLCCPGRACVKVYGCLRPSTAGGVAFEAPGLPGATVTWSGDAAGTCTTDADGWCCVDVPPPADGTRPRYEVAVSHPLFLPKTVAWDGSCLQPAVRVELEPRPDLVCDCGCVTPLPRVLAADDGLGTFSMVYDPDINIGFGKVGAWVGCHGGLATDEGGVMKIFPKPGDPFSLIGCCVKEDSPVAFGIYYALWCDGGRWVLGYNLPSQCGGYGPYDLCTVIPGTRARRRITGGNPCSGGQPGSAIAGDDVDCGGPVLLSFDIPLDPLDAPELPTAVTIHE